jgi:hypothetical protein
MGRPEDVAKNPRSLTGQWLAPLLKPAASREVKAPLLELTSDF